MIHWCMTKETQHYPSLGGCMCLSVSLDSPVRRRRNLISQVMMREVSLKALFMCDRTTYSVLVQTDLNFGAGIHCTQVN